MYYNIKRIILPYRTDSDPMWEQIGSEEVICAFNAFSRKDWDNFISEIPAGAEDTDSEMIDCLTQIGSPRAISAAARIAVSADEGGLSLFVMRLRGEDYSKADTADLVEIEKRAARLAAELSGPFAESFKRSLDRMRTHLCTVR